MTIQASSTPPRKHKNPSYHLRIFEAFNYSTGGRNAGVWAAHKVAGGIGTARAHARWQQIYRRLQTISTYFHPGSHGARLACARKISTHTHYYCLSNTCLYMCMTKRRCCCCHCHWSLPPVSPPQTFFFQANLNFCLRKKTTPHQTHTTICAKKRTLTGFLATRHQGCVLLKWYFDRQCNTYFTQNRFLYNCPRLVLFRSWALGRETGVCWETKSIYHVCDFEISDPNHKKSRSGHYSSMAK